MKFLGLLVATSIACGASNRSAEPGPLERVDLGQTHRGLSGLAWDGHGHLWAVSERGRSIVRLKPDGSDQLVVPIRGAPTDGDLESLAFVGGRQFAVGTEARSDGAQEAILILEVDGDQASVARRIAVDPLGVVGMSNQGIEGLCAVGQVLFAALETPIKREGARVARIVRIELATGKQTAFALALTSATGKISALDCRERDGRIEALAIERHFEVVRILRFELTAEPILTPTIVADIGDRRRESDNPEGVVWADEYSAWLILDNDYGEVTGPTELQRAPFETPYRPR